MANLYEVLADAQNGEAMTELSREFGLFAAANPGRRRAAACHIDGS
jgi:hypothetical protein